MIPYIRVLKALGVFNRIFSFPRRRVRVNIPRMNSVHFNQNVVNKKAVETKILQRMCAFGGSTWRMTFCKTSAGRRVLRRPRKAVHSASEVSCCGNPGIQLGENKSSPK